MSYYPKTALYLYILVVKVMYFHVVVTHEIKAVHMVKVLHAAIARLVAMDFVVRVTVITKPNASYFTCL